MTVTREALKALTPIVGSCWLIDESIERYVQEHVLKGTLALIMTQVPQIKRAMEDYSDRARPVLCALEHLSGPFRRRREIPYFILGRMASALGLRLMDEVRDSAAVKRLAAALDINDVSAAHEYSARWFAKGATLKDLAQRTLRTAEESLGLALAPGRPLEPVILPSREARS